MKGFRDFLMQGNLVELATAVIIGTSFAAVVESFTQFILDFIGMFGGQPDFSQVTIPFTDLNIGVFLTSLLSFIMVSAIVYFFVIKPYTAMKAASDARLKADKAAEPAAPTTDELLAEIRDLLKARNG
ncbi:MAG: large conductance mechanosensitive channel protein MscL [Propioniciclava sp.]|uniref:large conductance mechanosensitive channel protein MscL n=1 Tax=Propioniciclava sp. TaxID=2038686 RepID=UPI0039E5034C